MYDTTPAAAINDDLSLSQDAARAYLNTPWRMPTAAEFQELYDNCTSVWAEINGVNGRLFTSNVNGKTLFLPAVGYYNGLSRNDAKTRGYYWSSSYNSETKAVLLYFLQTGVTPNSTGLFRYEGLPIRPVFDPSI